MNSPAIRVEGLSKLYKIGQRERYYTLRDSLANFVKSPFRRLSTIFHPSSSNLPSSNLSSSNLSSSISHPSSSISNPPSSISHLPSASERDFIWALKDVSFCVAHGEVVGIIGRNGAGKTTLLKILSRITEPTEGYAEIRGKVGSLLEVGTGFHQELTGRENIYLSGAILGMKKVDIDKKFDEIIAFAELEKFLDTPVKRYSSGMYVRLAFAVAAHLEPEILLVDEVLAVGDAQFQKKCLGKMGDVAKEGRTVLFVSHNMGAVSTLCPICMLLESGRLIALGPSDQIVEQYLSTIYSRSAAKYFPPRDGVRGQIMFVRLLNDQGNETSDFPTGKNPIIEIGFTLRERVRGCHVACIISTYDGRHLFSTTDTDTNPSLFGKRLPGDYVSRVQLPVSLLNTGTYQVAVGLGIPGLESFDRQEAVSFTLHDVGDFGTMKEGTRRAGLLVVKVPWQYLVKPIEG